jgi:hypothetical protein
MYFICNVEHDPNVLFELGSHLNEGSSAGDCSITITLEGLNLFLQVVSEELRGVAKVSPTDVGGWVVASQIAGTINSTSHTTSISTLPLSLPES